MRVLHLCSGLWFFMAAIDYFYVWIEKRNLGRLLALGAESVEVGTLDKEVALVGLAAGLGLAAGWRGPALVWEGRLTSPPTQRDLLKAFWGDSDSRWDPGNSGGLGSHAPGALPGPGSPARQPCPAHSCPVRPSLDGESDQSRAASGFELFAAAVGNAQWLRFCLSQNTGDISEDGKGFTAIHFAAQHSKLECLRVLVEEFQFSVNRPTNNGQTPLHLAVRRDSRPVVLPCIHYLIKNKAAINAQTHDGCTPLHVAAREGLLSCMKVLVENGANVHAQDVTGCKPIDFCKIWNHRTCARFLKDAMWREEKEDLACEMEHLKQLKLQLVLLQQRYLMKCQEASRALNEAQFQKWLRSKQPREATSRPKIPDHPFRSSCLRHKTRATQQPLAAHTQPLLLARRPKLWDASCNLARLQGIRRGVQSDLMLEHDLSHFVRVRPDGHGGVRLHTVTGQPVGPVPQLPLPVVARTLHPSLQPSRMKVPEGFHPSTLRGVPQKRPGRNTFWTDTLAMTLRNTFDEPFLAAMRAHQGLPLPPAPSAAS
ncbi:ankyrin repeat domain-containing protein 53 [Rhynchocyon petersi]